MIVRRADRSDAAALSALAVRTYSDAFGHSFGAADLAAHLQRHLGEGCFERFIDEDVVLLAEMEARAVGFVQFGAVTLAVDGATGDDRELRRLHVDPDRQRQGTGRSLMDAALAHPQLRAAPNVYLDVWEHNHGAQRFYERYGFRVIGARRFAVESGTPTDLDLIMVRRSSALPGRGSSGIGRPVSSSGAPIHSDNLTTERPTFVTHLECAATGERHAADEVHNLSRAGRPLLVRYDLDGVQQALGKDALTSRPQDLWRYRELLPVRRARDIVSLGEAVTPLVALPTLAARLGAETLLVKDEGRLPTGSFKARGLVMAVSMAKALGIAHMAMPTNGNAGAALAAYASRAGIKATVFCPEDTPEVNVSEIALQGAAVYRVNGLIDDCGRIVAAGKAAAGWFDVSTLKEPYRIEGKKTMGLELAEQLGWDVPDVIFYPTGGGTGLIGMWKAFAELQAIGFIGSKRPRMIAVQAAGCAPLVRAWEAGMEQAPRWENAHTIAAGIRVPQAIGDFLILRAVRDSGGFAIAVADAAIAVALEEVARAEGFLMCPEGAATYAAYKQSLADGRVTPQERAVLFNCASGLKYPLPPALRRLDRHQPIDFAAL